ncbi:MAG: alpha/beta hydrolase, partial [Gammaproteobacteria bacterium]|nr:alpha/beta hydrolase [Gammaproteobacteria bacterium]
MIHYIQLFIFGLLLLNAWMYFQQPNIIFHPIQKLEETPENWGLEYDKVSLQTADNVQLHGWYIPHENADQVLLFFHGNAGNISH